MLTASYHNEMNCNRKLEKNLKPFSHIQILNWDLYINTMISAIQICDSFELKKETKYIVKKSIDVFILMHPGCSAEKLQFAAINLFRMALKYNEDPEKYDRITIQDCMIHCDPKYTKKDYVDFQLNHMKMDLFKLDFTTPQDYLGTYSKIFMLNQKDKRTIQSIIDYALTIPELICCYAEEIFFASLLMVFENSNVPVSWILSQTNHQQTSKEICELIRQYYTQQVRAP